jgi:hypothetical protein
MHLSGSRSEPYVCVNAGIYEPITNTIRDKMVGTHST